MVQGLGPCYQNALFFYAFTIVPACQCRTIRSFARYHNESGCLIVALVVPPLVDHIHCNIEWRATLLPRLVVASLCPTRTYGHPSVYTTLANRYGSHSCDSDWCAICRAKVGNHTHVHIPDALEPAEGRRIASFELAEGRRIASLSPPRADATHMCVTTCTWVRVCPYCAW